MHARISRRTLLASSTAMLVPGAAAARFVSGTDGFSYEVTRTREEWIELLGETTFRIMREGHTETPKSDPHWDSLAPGSYACRGCALKLYDAEWKVVVDIGWLFFRHSEPNTVLTAVDWPEESGMAAEFSTLAGIEVHCRRCGSHMGHIVWVEDKLLHCVNGAGLSFTAA